MAEGVEIAGAVRAVGDAVGEIAADHPVDQPAPRTQRPEGLHYRAHIGKGGGEDHRRTASAAQQGGGDAQQAPRMARGPGRVGAYHLVAQLFEPPGDELVFRQLAAKLARPAYAADKYDFFLLSAHCLIFGVQS